MKSPQQVSHSRHLIWNPSALADRAADAITGFVGSWIFVGIHAFWFVLWIVLRIEPFPYGLLTLLVSLEAIFLSTFVMMSQNRSAARDHIRDDHEAQEVDVLFQINQTQLEILTILRGTLCPPEGAVGAQPTQSADGARPSTPMPVQTPRVPLDAKAVPPRGSRRRTR
jgi:Protein of unknown function (DUF1003)